MLVDPASLPEPGTLKTIYRGFRNIKKNYARQKVSLIIKTKKIKLSTNINKIAIAAIVKSFEFPALGHRADAIQTCFQLRIYYKYVCSHENEFSFIFFLNF